MAPDEEPTKHQTGECARALSCSGWVVTRPGFVRCCEACRALPDEDAAHLAARTAGLDVQRNGFVAGLTGIGRRSTEPRSESHRATVSANDMLIGVLDQLQDVLRLDRLPPALRSSVDCLAIEVAKVQGVSEWIAEDLVRLVYTARGAEEPDDQF